MQAGCRPSLICKRPHAEAASTLETLWHRKIGAVDVLVVYARPAYARPAYARPRYRTRHSLRPAVQSF